MKTPIARSILALFLSLVLLVTMSHGAEPGKSKVIMGRSKADVDALLKDWPSRWSGDERPPEFYFYTQGVSLIIHFRNDKAIGVRAVQEPLVGRGNGVSSIPMPRFEELVKLIGQRPKDNEIQKDSRGVIHGFWVGDNQQG